MFEIRDVLDRARLDPTDVNAMLCSPREPRLATLLPSLIATDPGVMEADQSTNGTNAEGALGKDRPLVGGLPRPCKMDLIAGGTDGKRSVGSASGEENLLGRRQKHISDDVGVIVGLFDRDPVDVRFSILERTPPDATPAEVSRLGQTWMERLRAVAFGLNRPASEAADGP
jgi:hypothetical protein